MKLRYINTAKTVGFVSRVTSSSAPCGASMTQGMYVGGQTCHTHVLSPPRHSHSHSAQLGRERERECDVIDEQCSLTSGLQAQVLRDPV
jgi:hypothetical protein